MKIIDQLGHNRVFLSDSELAIGALVREVACLASLYKIFSPNSRIGVLSFRPCNVCVGVFRSLPLVHQIRSELHLPTQYPCIDAPVQRSVFWLDHPRVPHDSVELAVSPTGGLSCTVWLPS